MGETGFRRIVVRPNALRKAWRPFFLGGSSEVPCRVYRLAFGVGGHECNLHVDGFPVGLTNDEANGPFAT
jgi:hypothetical protein